MNEIVKAVIYARVSSEEQKEEGVILTPKSGSHEKLVHGLKVLLAKNFIDNLREETLKGRKGTRRLLYRTSPLWL